MAINFRGNAVGYGDKDIHDKEKKLLTEEPLSLKWSTQPTFKDNSSSSETNKGGSLRDQEPTKGSGTNNGVGGSGVGVDKGSSWYNDLISQIVTATNGLAGDISKNPLESEMAKGILDYYGVLGYNSGNAVKGATAGENAGNIDSYAVANADRQRMARYGEAISAIAGMDAQRYSNLANLYSALGINVDHLFANSDEGKEYYDYKGKYEDASAEYEKLLGLYNEAMGKAIPTVNDLAEYMRGYYNQAWGSGTYESQQKALDAVTDMMRKDERFSFVPYYLFWEAQRKLIENGLTQEKTK